MRRARGGDEQGRLALADLCAAYWPPVYAFFRREGMAADDARDLTQGLFAELLERGDVAGGDPGHGRFRNYLLACARHYRSKQRDRERAQKRGGGREHLPIRAADPDAAGADEFGNLVAALPAADRTPEQIHFGAWVRAAIALALHKLAVAEQHQGRGEQFALLRGSLEGEGLAPSHAVIAERLHSTEAAIKVAVHRLRQRFRAALLRELGATVEHADEAEAELRELLAALG